MKIKTLALKSCALSIAAALSLSACSGSDSNGDTAVSGPAPAPAPPSPGLTGADIDMTQAFSQTLNCYYGEKPYYDTSITGPWTVAFDGDLLSLNSTVGSQSFGGRLSNTAGPPVGITREDTADAATISTFLGGTGTLGNIFFTKTIDGTVTRAGHNQFAGTSPRLDSVECGADRDNQWLALPTSRPFSLVADVFAWSDAQIQLNCAVRPAGSTVFDTPFPAALVTVDNGPLIVNNGSDDVFRLEGVDQPDRTESVPIDSPRVGASIWQSDSDTDGSRISVSVRPSDRMLRNVQETLANGRLTNCVPAPLDPTF